MLVRNVLRKGKQLRSLNRFCFADSDVLKKTSSEDLQTRIKTFQFSKEVLTDFGDLPRGQVPQSLQVDPKFDHFKLKNGSQIGFEHFDGHHSGRNSSL